MFTYQPRLHQNRKERRGRSLHGDPLWLVIRCDDEGMTIDDRGAVAGLLFSLDQDEQHAPAFRLLSSLAQWSNFTIDYDEGVMRGNCSFDSVANVLPNFIKIVQTILVAAPHSEKKTRPRRRSLGPRLRRRIYDYCKEKDILDRIDRRSYIRGSAKQEWPTDFHWRKFSNRSRRNVFVLTTDLGIQDPMRKAERVSILALDTRHGRASHDLRVVIDSEDFNGDEAVVAANLIREQGQELHYTVFDYSNSEDRKSFLTQADSELLTMAAKRWIDSFEWSEESAIC